MQRYKVLMLVIPMLLITASANVLLGCQPIGCFNFPIPDTAFRFSVKNKTNVNLSLKLVVGEIPSPNARYNEFVPIPDDTFQLANERFTSTRGAVAIVKAKGNNAVRTFLLLLGLSCPAYKEQADQPKMIELQKRLMDKLISFIFTISYGDTVVYQMVGWDLPDEDVTVHQIDEKLCGYYDTAEEKWKVEEYWQAAGDVYGHVHGYPLLYSKLWQNGQANWPYIPTYYIVANTLDAITLQDFKPATDQTISDDEYWRKH